MKAVGKGGTMAYLYNLATGLFQYENVQLSIIVDGSEVVNDKVFSMSIGICRYNGGGMMQLPNAIPDDGLYDITVIRKTTKWRIVKNIKNLYDGSFISLPEVDTFRGKTINITSTPRHSIHLETDGESLGVSPLDFSIVPRAIRLIVRKKALKEFGSDQAGNGNDHNDD